MYRSLIRTVLFFAALFAAVAAYASAYDDLIKAQDAFQKAKSWHAEENFSNGRTTILDYVAPDRWRVQPTPKVTELVIGDDVYMVNNGKANRMPFGGSMIRKMIQQNWGEGLQSEEVKRSVRDLGTQTLDGKSVHVYSYTVQGNPVTIYIGGDSLPVQTIVHNKNLTTTIKYSKYNAPISIETP